MTVEGNQLEPRRSRLLYGGLIASLALNLLFVGLFATAAWEHRHKPPKNNEPGLLGFVRELPADRQGPVRSEITAAHELLNDLRAMVRKSWLDTNALLTAEPYDKEKFKAALTGLAEMEAKYKRSIYYGMADTAEKLTPEERKLLQAWREKRRLRLLAKLGEKPKDDDKSN